MTSVLVVLTWVLAVAGVLGMIVQSVIFVRVTMPHHYGSNPGFGAYESSVAPWWAALCIAYALHTHAALIPLVAFFVGFLGLGLVAQLLGRVFGRRGG